MPHARHKAKARRTLWPWVGWGLPFLLVPGAVLFVETYLNLRLLEADYRTMQLREEIERLQESLQELRAQEAELGHNMETLERQAEGLGLREPTLDQLVIVGPGGMGPEKRGRELPIFDMQVAKELGPTERGGPRPANGR